MIQSRDILSDCSLEERQSSLRTFADVAIGGVANNPRKYGIAFFIAAMLRDVIDQGTPPFRDRTPPCTNAAHLGPIFQRFFSIQKRDGVYFGGLHL